MRANTSPVYLDLHPEEVLRLWHTLPKYSPYKLQTANSDVLIYILKDISNMNII